MRKVPFLFVVGFLLLLMSILFYSVGYMVSRSSLSVGKNPKTDRNLSVDLAKTAKLGAAKAVDLQGVPDSVGKNLNIIKDMFGETNIERKVSSRVEKDKKSSFVKSDKTYNRKPTNKVANIIKKHTGVDVELPY